MSAVRATLHLDLSSERNASAITVGVALTAWAEAVEAAMLAVDPYSVLSVELVGTQAGSLKLHAVLRFIEREVFDSAAAALEPYPRLKAALALNVFGLPGVVTGGVLGGLIVAAVQDAGDKAPAIERAAAEAEKRVSQSADAHQKAQRFYRSLERDSAVTGVRVIDDTAGQEVVAVSRDEFAIASGLWELPSVEEEGVRTRQAIWDVVVTHPVAIGKPMKWGFTRDGLAFKAKVTDSRFLLAIRERRLPLQIHEGELLRVEIEWQERADNGVWTADRNTYEVTSVLWPTSLEPASPLPLFPKPSSDTDQSG